VELRRNMTETAEDLILARDWLCCPRANVSICASADLLLTSLQHDIEQLGVKGSLFRIQAVQHRVPQVKRRHLRLRRLALDLPASRRFEKDCISFGVTGAVTS